MEFTQTLDNVETWLLALTLTSARFMGFFYIFPITASELIPATVRNGMAVVMAAFVTPLTMATISAAKEPLQNLLLIGVKEAIVGALFGFALGTIIWTFEALGALIEFQSGSANSQVFDPLSNSETGLYSKLFTQIATMLFMTAGGLVLSMSLLIDSFIAWPINQWVPDFYNITFEIVRYMQSNFWTALLQYSLATMAVVFLAEIFFGITGKYAPQLNISQLSLPIKSILLLFTVGLTLPAVSGQFVEYLNGWFELLRGSLGK